jgi:P-type Ca2+ transporter type 2C
MEEESQMRNWHQTAIPRLLEILSATDRGLSVHEASKRLLTTGPNEISEGKTKSAWPIFLSQFKDLMIIVLICAAVISAAMGDISDMMIILAIIFLNAVIGFTQEYKAEKAISALKQLAVPYALVMRNQQLTHISSTALVPGDLVILEAGNIIPADIRLSETHRLAINESSLTGESVPVEKHSKVLDAGTDTPDAFSNMAFKGTYITQGRARGYVVETGMNTELGKIARLIQQPGVKTPLQKKTGELSKKLSYIILLICAVVFFSGLLRGEHPSVIFLTALSLAVAAIPETLPAVITIALSTGAKKMSKKNALIRKLPAVETLGSVTYICTDKTGTLTLNKMKVEQIAGNHFEPGKNISAETEESREFKLFIECMALNNDAYGNSDKEMIGDPTEVGLMEYARSRGYERAVLEKKFPRIAEIPFDSERKCMTTIHKRGHKYIAFTKGSPEMIMNLSDDSTIDAELEEKLNKMLNEGYRVLAFASREFDQLPPVITPDTIEYQMQFAGIAGLIDPPRKEVKNAVEECHTAGIKVAMITGDHIKTATIIAKRLSLLENETDQVLSGSQLKAMKEDALRKVINQIKVYARISPEQKLKIIKALQENGEYVAMTGDGVNDAPALRHADIGIAMGIAGTDTAKEAAHLILLNDNFTSIVAAIKEGRRIFDNILKFIRYILTGNAVEVLTIFLAPFFSLPVPLLPVHILWINLVTDSLPGIALLAEPADKNIMNRPPRSPQQGIITSGLVFQIIWVCSIFTFLSLTLQSYGIKHTLHWQTMVFTVLAVGQLFLAFAVRGEKNGFFRLNIFANPTLLAVVAVSFCIQLMVIYIPFFNGLLKTEPLTPLELSVCLAISLSIILIAESEKLFSKYIISKKGL